MRSLNRVMLLGYLGQDPELLESRQRRKYTKLSVATRRNWKNEEDQWQERTEWHSVTVWGTDAENCVNYLQKGSLVMVEGSLTSFEATDTESERSHKIWSVRAQRVHFLAKTKPQLLAQEA